MKNRIFLKAFLALAALGVFVWIGYLLTQEPKLSLSSEHFGLMLFKGGYRSWFLSFSDGQVPTFERAPDPKPLPPPPASSIYVTNLSVTNVYVTNYFGGSPEAVPVWRSVVLSKDGLTFRLGYRLIPKFSHTDLRKFIREHSKP